MEPKNCAAIVTGGASGMGAATARALSKAGAKVTILDQNKKLGEQVAAEIQGFFVHCDVTSESSVVTALQAARQKHGSARIGVNCAGIVKSTRMIGKQGPMSLAEFKQVIEINLIGTFNVMRLVAADMMTMDAVGESQERGIILNTASIAAFEGQIGQTAYSASKGGVVGLTLPAARELASFGIRVVAIAPGLVDTPMFEKIPDEARRALADSVPFPKRLARPDEYAALILHVIQNEMINGTVIRLDGALRMQAK